ncbi:MAG TPA: hypothetical protein VGO59_14765 [Verrucomicrobiae bacterium]|jgi:hypothetical protein
MGDQVTFLFLFHPQRFAFRLSAPKVTTFPADRASSHEVTGRKKKMKTQIPTSIEKFVTQQRMYQNCLRLFKQMGAPRLVITRLERDKAWNACRFFLTHAFPNVLPHNAGNKPQARRARPQAGSERAKQTASKKGKQNT